MARKIWFFSPASLHEGHARTSDNPERISPKYSGAIEKLKLQLSLTVYIYTLLHINLYTCAVIYTLTDRFFKGLVFF